MYVLTASVYNVFAQFGSLSSRSAARTEYFCPVVVIITVIEDLTSRYIKWQSEYHKVEIY